MKLCYDVMLDFVMLALHSTVYTCVCISYFLTLLVWYQKLVTTFDEVAVDFDDPCGLFAVSSSSNCTGFDIIR